MGCFFFFSDCLVLFCFFPLLLRCEFALNLKGLRAVLSLSRENKSNKVVSCGRFMFIAVPVDCWDCRRWSLINHFNIILELRCFPRKITVGGDSALPSRATGWSR